MEDIPEPDCLSGAPHPRRAARVFGHEEAERAFLDAYSSGRLHHAWLLTGPRGVGKATFAWRMARFLLAQPAGGPEEGGLFGAPEPPATLDVAPGDAVARRVAALSEPRLFLLRRPYDTKTKRLRKEITVDAAHRLKEFFALSAADGGRRVVIVDAADELNPSAANAILKLLEEPPQNAILLLVAHQPARLLPTIRSRCRTLRLRPLGPADLADALAQAGAEPVEGPSAPSLVALSEGSVGAAWSMIENDGFAFYGTLIRLLERAPGMDRKAMLAAAETDGELLPGRIALIELLLARLARTGISGPPEPEAAPGEHEILARLSPDAGKARLWAEVQQRQGDKVRRGAAANLDPSALLLDTLLAIDGAAGAHAAA